MTVSSDQPLRHAAFEQVLDYVEAGVEPYIVGPAGCGKTSIAKQIAEKTGRPFYYTGAVDSAFQLRGFRDANGNVVRTPYRDAYEHGGVFLFDELDASDSQAIISVHASLDNGILDAPDGMIEKHKDFVYLAAANTWGNGATLDYIGRNALDGATLDRYAFIPIDYDLNLENQLAIKSFALDAATWTSVVQQARFACRDLDIKHVVSTRAIVKGIKLLEKGRNIHEVFKTVVTKGLPEDDGIKVVKKITSYSLEDVELKLCRRKSSNITADADVLRKLDASIDDSLAGLAATLSILRDLKVAIPLDVIAAGQTLAAVRKTIQQP